ncbi:LysM peptidoglycan-binding domain-containing protein [Bacillus pinisoli]|uniref:LysM peptidoglycan-binding domain-containing protein n=1 Tax=Bacillus pinisoli TaxID=2901866 RepID=UPI001FF5284D|nr:LysM peptidoglycan-binding domain-containing protein [Bacillus pinisoli]
MAIYSIKLQFGGITDEKNLIRMMVLSLGIASFIGFTNLDGAEAKGTQYSQVQVEKGDMLYAIAKKNGMSIKELETINKLKTTKIFPC